jgi:hypothetical protein
VTDGCEICTREQAAHTHHRKRRSQGGTDAPANLMRLCFGCHERVHREPAWAYDNGYLVASWDDPVEVPCNRMVEHEHEGACRVCGESLTKKPRSRKSGEERRKRRRITVAVPKDREDGGALWDEYLELTKEHLVRDGLYSADDDIPAYEALIAAQHAYHTIARADG